MVGFYLREVNKSLFEPPSRDKKGNYQLSTLGGDVGSTFLYEEVMVTSNKGFDLFWLMFLICFGCVPLQQQISESEDAQIEGFVGPLIIDEEKFVHIASLNVYDRLNVMISFSLPITTSHTKAHLTGNWFTFGIVSA